MDTMTLNPVRSHAAQVSPAAVHTSAVQDIRTEAPKTTMTDKTSIQANAKPLSHEEQKKVLHESTDKFNKMSDKLNLDIKFAYNDKIDQVYLNVIDKNTGQIIRKLPSEEAMKISESMKELVGNLLDKKG